MHRILTNAELADLHGVGAGYVFNDFTSGPSGARDNVLHGAWCPWIERMLDRTAPDEQPSVRKIFFGSLPEALSWLASNRGPESRGWKCCATCRPDPAYAGKPAARAGLASWVGTKNAFAPDGASAPAFGPEADSWAVPAFAKPSSAPIPLPVPPRLASWNKAADPDQVQLSEYLAVAGAVLRPRCEQLTGPLALRLDVGLPRHADLLDQRDLDNYLLPLAALVRQTGQGELACVWGTKQHCARSYVRIESAIPAATVPPAGWRHIIRTHASSQTEAFKEQIRDQLRDTQPLPPGPVRMQMSFTVGPSRNWLNLWKPAIDALGKMLGHAGVPDSWSPLDGRIVDLGLHCRVDPTMRNDVLIAIAAEGARA
jgi:hypothetical protein